MLDHDGQVRVGRRRRRIGDVTRATLPAHIPALTDLFERCGTDYHLSLDLKGAAAGPAVIAVVRGRRLRTSCRGCGCASRRWPR